ncbi:MAG: hypothetical protein ABH834_06305 [Candidatus Altiarchaeota archaeon]
MSPRRMRAQSSIEYIATYSWVIVVILVGVLIVWKMGILKTQPQQRGVMGFSQVYVTDFSASAPTSIIQVNIKSDAGDSITILPGGINTSMEYVLCDPAPSIPTDISPGEDVVVNVSCPGPPSLADKYNTGDFFNANVIINYSNTRSGRQHLSKGRIFGPIEAVS